MSLPLPYDYADDARGAIEAFAARNAIAYRDALGRLIRWVEGDATVDPSPEVALFFQWLADKTDPVFEARRVLTIARLTAARDSADKLIAARDQTAALAPVAEAYEILARVQTQQWRTFEDRPQLGDYALLLLLAGMAVRGATKGSAAAKGAAAGALVQAPTLSAAARAALLGAAAGAGAAIAMGPGKKFAIGAGVALVGVGVIWLAYKYRRGRAREAESTAMLGRTAVLILPEVA